MNKLCRGMLVAAALAVAPTAAPAQAPSATDSTAYVVTYIEVLPAAKAEAANLLKQVASASRKEPGNLRYDILQRIERDNQFAILEAWSDLKAAGAHEGGAALKQFKEKLTPLRASFYDERPSNGITVAPASGPVGKDAVYTVIHVDVTPPTKDECIAMLKKLARRYPQGTRFPALRGVAAEQSRQSFYRHGNLEESQRRRCAFGHTGLEGVPRKARNHDGRAVRRAAVHQRRLNRDGLERRAWAMALSATARDECLRA